jgi:hypothetical protein
MSDWRCPDTHVHGMFPNHRGVGDPLSPGYFYNTFEFAFCFPSKNINLNRYLLHHEILYCYYFLDCLCFGYVIMYCIYRIYLIIAQSNWNQFDVTWAKFSGMPVTTGDAEYYGWSLNRSCSGLSCCLE